MITNTIFLQKIVNIFYYLHIISPENYVITSHYFFAKIEITRHIIFTKFCENQREFLQKSRFLKIKYLYFLGSGYSSTCRKVPF